LAPRDASAYAIACCAIARNRSSLFDSAALVWVTVVDTFFHSVSSICAAPLASTAASAFASRARVAATRPLESTS
jgi:hypothetical protein